MTYVTPVPVKKLRRETPGQAHTGGERRVRVRGGGGAGGCPARVSAATTRAVAATASLLAAIRSDAWPAGACLASRPGRGMPACPVQARVVAGADSGSFCRQRQSILSDSQSCAQGWRRADAARGAGGADASAGGGGGGGAVGHAGRHAGDAVRSRGGGGSLCFRARRRRRRRRRVRRRQAGGDGGHALCGSVGGEAAAAGEAAAQPGESFMRVHWVAVPEALHARRVNRPSDAARSSCSSCCRGRSGAAAARGRCRCCCARRLWCASPLTPRSSQTGRF
jgi:hypothetical protein